MSQWHYCVRNVLKGLLGFWGYSLVPVNFLEENSLFKLILVQVWCKFLLFYVFKGNDYAESVFSFSFELIHVHVIISNWKVMDNLLILWKGLVHILMTKTPKLKAVNNYVSDPGFFGNFHRLKNSPSAVCVPNMKTITICSTPKLNFPGLYVGFQCTALSSKQIRGHLVPI